MVGLIANCKLPCFILSCRTEVEDTDPEDVGGYDDTMMSHDEMLTSTATTSTMRAGHQLMVATAVVVQL